MQGPIETPTGSYVFQVDSITPETTQSFDQVRDQIVQQINSTKEQEVFASFLSSYQSYWSSITFCGEDYLIDRCDNFTGEAQPCPDPNLPEAQQQQQLTQQGCPPPAPTISPVAPARSSCSHRPAAVNPRSRTHRVRTPRRRPRPAAFPAAESSPPASATARRIATPHYARVLQMRGCAAGEAEAQPVS